MNWKPVANKIEEMIKESIVDNRLVKTGKLLKSISVSADNKGNYTISAEDYFPYLDLEYKILDKIFKSSELEQFIQKVYVDDILIAQDSGFVYSHYNGVYKVVIDQLGETSTNGVKF